jgi:hypothetical protein
MVPNGSGEKRSFYATLKISFLLPLRRLPLKMALGIMAHFADAPPPSGNSSHFIHEYAMTLFRTLNFCSLDGDSIRISPF